MAPLDALLFWLFLSIAVIGLGWSAFAFRKAFRYADAKRDPDGVKMFFWACGGLAGLAVAGMGAAYFLLPLILHYAFH